jgi:hypothetical protein
MGRLISQPLTGQQVGKWLVGEAFKHPTRGEQMYRCVCECGTQKDVKHSHLSAGKTKSCGCSWTKHNMSRSNEYRIWDSMIRRCHNPDHKAYALYGARGITVCDKWKKFEGFFEDMGLKPDGLTLERVDNSLGYSKENCKWVSVKDQARNRRSTKLDIDKVESIKNLLENKVSQSEIASLFNVSRSSIGHISSGATWR